MISVCIPTFNGGNYIKEQIDSILSQLSFADEIIISDDQSTDNTIEIINSYNDDRIKIFPHIKKQVGESQFKFDLTTRNMENAINQAVGDYIFMADQDDVWEVGRITTVLSLLKKYTLVVTDCKVVNDNLEVIHESYYYLVNSKVGMIKNFSKNSYLGCCMAFKKEILKFALPFPIEPVPHDIWLGLIAEIYGRVYFLNEKTILYRRHQNNLSDSAEISTNSLNFKVRYRMLLLKALIKRSLEAHKYFF